MYDAKVSKILSVFIKKDDGLDAPVPTIFEKEEVFKRSHN